LEEDAPPPQHLVEPDEQGVERLARVHLTAPGLDLGQQRLEGLAGGIGVDVVPVGASFSVALDAPPEEIQSVADVGDQGLLR
jgi:hypothetical protein